MGLDGGVERRDLPAENGMTGGLAIAQLKVGPHLPAGEIGQRQELLEAEGLDIRSTQQVASLELPPREVPLELEVGKSHRLGEHTSARARAMRYQLPPVEAEGSRL